MHNPQKTVDQTILAFAGEAERNGYKVAVRATMRCVVTTLAQDDLPRDPGLLRTVTVHPENTGTKK